MFFKFNDKYYKLLWVSLSIRIFAKELRDILQPLNITYIIMTQSDKDQFYILIGNAIRDARINKDMSQAHLAEKIDMSRTSIVNIEKGRQNPPIHILWQFSRLLKVSITDLLPKFTLLKNNDVDFFEEKLRESIDKGIIDENSEQNLQSFLREK